MMCYHLWCLPSMLVPSSNLSYNYLKVYHNLHQQVPLSSVYGKDHMKMTDQKSIKDVIPS